MKTIKTFIALTIVLLGFNACQTDDDLNFVAQAPSDFALTNTFLEQYVLTPGSDANDNIGVLFAWHPANFDVPTNVSYMVQYSLMGDFTDAADAPSVSATSETQMTLSIGDLKAIAEEAGLDNDPNTDNPDNGTLYFRVRAFVGDASSTTESFTPTQAINVFLPAAATGGGGGVQIASWGVVGSGYNNWGAFADGAFYTTSIENVLVSYVTLVDGELKFRENNAWDNNYGDTGADGTLDAGGDNIIVTAGDYKITLNLNDNTYTIVPFSYGIVGEAYNDWGSAGPDAKFYYDYTTDTFKVGVKLLDGAMKIRLNNDWGTNYGDTGADGTLEQDGSDIVVTAGHYLITADFNNNTYTIESADVWGIVGSAYNDWGGAGPDFSLTEVQPGVFVGDIVTLIDGAMKFRLNNAWDSNLGDDNADGTVEANGADINTTAGSYRVILDLNNNTYQLNQAL